MHVLSSGQTESLCLSCLGCFLALHVKVKDVKDLWNLWTLSSCPTHHSCLGKVACTCYPDNVWGPLTCPLFRDKGTNSWDSLWAFWLAALKVLVLSTEGNNLQALSMAGPCESELEICNPILNCGLQPLPQTRLLIWGSWPIWVQVDISRACRTRTSVYSPNYADLCDYWSLVTCAFKRESLPY